MAIPITKLVESITAFSGSDTVFQLQNFLPQVEAKLKFLSEISDADSSCIKWLQSKHTKQEYEYKKDIANSSKHTRGLKLALTAQKDTV